MNEIWAIRIVECRNALYSDTWKPGYWLRGYRNGHNDPSFMPVERAVDATLFSTLTNAEEEFLFRKRYIDIDIEYEIIKFTIANSYGVE